MKKHLTVFALTLAFSLLLARGIQAQQNTVTFEILAPKEGQTLYGQKLPILFNVENFELTNPDTATKVATPGKGHIHIWLDQDTTTAENATKVFENTFIYSDVKYGEHTLRAELVGEDHKPLTPPQKVTITFKTDSLPQTNSPEISSSFDKTTAVVILAVVAIVILAAWWYTKDEDDEIMDEDEKEAKSKKTVAKKPKAKGKKKKTKK